MVQRLADVAGEPLEERKVDQPRLFGEGAFDLDEEVVVVAVDGLELVGEGGEMAGGEAQPVPLDGDAIGHGDVLPAAGARRWRGERNGVNRSRLAFIHRYPIYLYAI